MRLVIIRLIMAFGFIINQSNGRIAEPQNNNNDFANSPSSLWLPNNYMYNATTNILENGSGEKTDRSQVVQNRSRKLNPQTGTRPVLVVLTYFQDHADRSRPDVSEYEDLFAEIANWFSLNSFGNYEMEPIIVGWYPVDNTEAHYSFSVSGYDDRLQEAFWPIMNSIGEQPGWDWSQFDSDGDNNLDGVIFLHSGYGAEMGQLECTNNNNNDPQNRIQSRAINTATNDDNVWSSGDIRVDGYVVASAYGAECTTERAIMGVITHEMMHTFEDSLPDLYEAGPNSVGLGIGSFDIMANAYGPQNDPMLPGHLSAWSKYQLTWMEPQQVWEDGVYRLRPAATFPDALIIRDHFERSEYLLLENRQQIEYDAGLWTGGLVIYHVDGRAELQTARGYPGQEGWPGNGNHYEVAVLQADENYDLERGINRGDAGDFWTPGMVLGPGEGNTIFPNTDSYQGGNIVETGITITVLEPDEDVVRVRIEGIYPAEPTPGPTRPPVSTPTNSPTQATPDSTTSPPSASPTAQTTQPTTPPDTTLPPTEETADTPSEPPEESDNNTTIIEDAPTNTTENNSSAINNVTTQPQTNPDSPSNATLPPDEEPDGNIFEQPEEDEVTDPVDNTTLVADSNITSNVTSENTTEVLTEDSSANNTTSQSPTHPSNDTSTPNNATQVPDDSNADSNATLSVSNTTAPPSEEQMPSEQEQDPVGSDPSEDNTTAADSSDRGMLSWVWISLAVLSACAVWSLLGLCVLCICNRRRGRNQNNTDLDYYYDYDESPQNVNDNDRVKYSEVDSKDSDSESEVLTDVESEQAQLHNSKVSDVHTDSDSEELPAARDS